LSMAYKRKRMTYKKKAAKKPYRKKVMKKGKSFATKVKQVVMKASEGKETRINWNLAELFHNVWNTSGNYHLNQPAIMPSQNLTQTGRVGDNIYSSRIVLRLMITQFADRPNVNYRYVFYSLPQGRTATYTDVFVNTTAVVMLDDFNRDNVQVIKTGTFRPNQASLLFGDNTRSYTFFKKFVLPHKKLYKFGPGEGTTTHNQRDFYFAIVCYDAHGTLQTDKLCQVKAFEEFHYKDF